MPRILLVEDNEMNRDMLSRRLARRGFDVTIAADGLQGLASALEAPPDLILMDLSLPGIDGWEATRRLKADPVTQSIPVIALTAHAMAGDRERAFEAGCDDYDIKPIDFARLIGKIEGVLGSRGDQVTRETSTNDSPTSPSPGQLRHDLIGPLVRIIGYCELLAEDIPPIGRGPRTEALQAIRSLAHEIRRTIDTDLLYPAEPGQPVDLESLKDRVLKPATAIIDAAEILKDASTQSPDRDTVLEDLDRIQKDAALLIEMVWQMTGERANHVA